VLEFPQASVTVKVTAFGPTFEQSNAEGDTWRVKSAAAVQLSLLLSFTSAPEIVAVPSAPNEMLMFFALAVGLKSSETVIVWVKLAGLPQASAVDQTRVNT
jgi:hypothetical protein